MHFGGAKKLVNLNRGNNGEFGIARVLYCRTQANSFLSCISLSQQSGQVLSGLRN